MWEVVLWYKQTFRKDHKICASSPRKGRLLEGRYNPANICSEFYTGGTSHPI